MSFSKSKTLISFLTLLALLKAVSGVERRALRWKNGSPMESTRRLYGKGDSRKYYSGSGSHMSASGSYKGSQKGSASFSGSRSYNPCGKAGRGKGGSGSFSGSFSGSGKGKGGGSFSGSFSANGSAGKGKGVIASEISSNDKSENGDGYRRRYLMASGSWECDEEPEPQQPEPETVPPGEPVEEQIRTWDHLDISNDGDKHGAFTPEETYVRTIKIQEEVIQEQQELIQEQQEFIQEEQVLP